VPYAWPRTLVTPNRPPKLVYLDLNHWIGFARANTGHRDGEKCRPILDACLAAAASNDAVFPISDAIYMEVGQIVQHRQRRDLREVIELLSGFRVITSRVIIATHEVEAVLDAAIGPNPRPINTMAYLDWGVARAFGMAGGFRVKDADGSGITERARIEWDGGPAAFDQFFAEAELRLNRETLAGPSPDQEDELRAFGWDPGPAIRTAELRAQQEIEQVARFNADPRWRRGRIRDVVSAREVLIEINEILYRGIAERGSSLDEVFNDLDVNRAIMDSMPSFDVAVTLKTAYHQDPNHRWTKNDVHDIDALATTVPYCDIVVTDRAVASHANRTGLAQRLGTTVLGRAQDLPNSL